MASLAGVMAQIAEGVTPRTTGVKILTPLDIDQQRAEIAAKQAQARQVQLQEEEQAHEIRKQERALRDQDIMSRVLADWDPKTEGGLGLLSRSAKAGVSATTGVGVSKIVMDLMRTASQVKKEDVDALEVRSRMQGGLLEAIDKAADPAERDRLISQGLQEYPEWKPEDLAPNSIKNTANALKLQGWFLDEAKKRADISKTEVGTEREQRQLDASALAAAARTGPDALETALDDLPFKRAKVFVGLKTPDDILKAGSTPAEQLRGTSPTDTGQFVADYMKRNPKATIEDATKALALARRQPPVELMLTPKPGGGYTGLAVEPGTDVPAGAVTRAGASSMEVPTAATRTMVETAPKVRDLANTTLALLNAQEKELGPGISRWYSFWTGEIGLPNPRFKGLKDSADLLATLLMRMHVGARGGEFFLKKFEGIIGAGKQSPENLRASLAIIRHYADLVSAGKSMAQAARSVGVDVSDMPDDLMRDLGLRKEDLKPATKSGTLKKGDIVHGKDGKDYSYKLDDEGAGRKDKNNWELVQPSAQPKVTPAPVAAPVAASAPPPAAPQEAPARAVGVSADGIGRIKKSEGFSATQYEDRGKAIGYGHHGPDLPEKVTEDEAHALLLSDLKPIESFIHQTVEPNLNQKRFDALASFGYNAGQGALGNIISVLNENGFDAAGLEMLKYTRFKGKKAPGLIARRMEEANLMKAKK